MNPYYPIINLVMIAAKLPVSVFIYVTRNDTLACFMLRFVLRRKKLA